MPRGTGLLLNGARTKCHNEFLLAVAAGLVGDTVGGECSCPRKSCINDIASCEYIIDGGMEVCVGMDRKVDAW